MTVGEGGCLRHPPFETPSHPDAGRGSAPPSRAGSGTDKAGSAAALRPAACLPAPLPPRAPSSHPGARGPDSGALPAFSGAPGASAGREPGRAGDRPGSEARPGGVGRLSRGPATDPAAARAWLMPKGRGVPGLERWGPQGKAPPTREGRSPRGGPLRGWKRPRRGRAGAWALRPPQGGRVLAPGGAAGRTTPLDPASAQQAPVGSAPVLDVASARGGGRQCPRSWAWRSSDARSNGIADGALHRAISCHARS